MTGRTHPKYSELAKVPPQAVELEQAILGAMMLEKPALSVAIAILTPDCFYIEANQIIYSTMLDMVLADKPVDLLTVTQELRKAGKLQEVGGAIYVTRLTNHVNSAANIEAHSVYVLEQSIKRKLIAGASELAMKGYQDECDIFTLLDQLSELADTLNAIKPGASAHDMAQDISDTLQQLQDESQGKTRGPVPSNHEVRRILNSYSIGDMITIAARPGMGKTAHMLSEAYDMACRGIPVGIQSLEMSRTQLIIRLICMVSEVSFDDIAKNRMDDERWERIYMAAKAIAKVPIYLFDDPINSREIGILCKERIAKYGIQLLFIDYLQLVDPPPSKSYNTNREAEVSAISRSIKNTAKKLKIPIIAYSQLSRDVEKRGGLHKPNLSDIRESGTIEQDSAVVMFLYRPEYYGITELEGGIPSHGYAEIIIAKNRHGSIGIAKARFIGRITKYTDWEPDESYISKPVDKPDPLSKSTGAHEFETEAF